MEIKYRFRKLLLYLHSYNPLEDAAKKICDNVQVISGAAKVGNALVAIAEGYTAALNL